LVKSRKVPEHFPFWYPQQLRFHSPKLEHGQLESHTNYLHFKKNLVKIGLPYQKLLNFGRKKSKFPTVQPLKSSNGQMDGQSADNSFFSRIQKYAKKILVANVLIG
jgi:hypothetical protein